MGQWRNPPYRVGQSASAVDTGRVTPWGITLLGIPDIWATGERGKNAKVCVIDTGFDSGHPDFVNAIGGAKDFTGSPYGIEDQVGHGTHVLGSIGARDNGQGIVGGAPDSILFVAKALGDNGSGDSNNVAAAFYWGIDMQVHIISASLGSPVGDPMIQAAMQAAVSAGIIVICAAGNDGKTVDTAGNVVDTVGYPAAWGDLAIAVGAIDESGAVADFSSRGPQLDVVAPGKNILSCWPGNRYAYLSGTSMATPMVAGCAALAVSNRIARGLPPFGCQKKFGAALDATSTPLATGGAAPSLDWGYGLISARKLLDSATASVPALGSTTEPATVHVSLGAFLGYQWELDGTKIA